MVGKDGAPLLMRAGTQWPLMQALGHCHPNLVYSMGYAYAIAQQIVSDITSASILSSASYSSTHAINFVQHGKDEKAIPTVGHDDASA